MRRPSSHTLHVLASVLCTVLVLAGILAAYTDRGSFSNVAVGFFVFMCFMAFVPPGPLLTVWLVGSLKKWVDAHCKRGMRT